MSYIQKLDEELPEGGNTLHDRIGQWDYIDPRGKKPMPLRSAWHMHERDAAPPKTPVFLYYLDCRETGDTLCKVESMEDLNEAIKALVKDGFNPVVRPYIINDETLEVEAQERRKARQLGTYML